MPPHRISAVVTLVRLRISLVPIRHRLGAPTPIFAGHQCRQRQSEMPATEPLPSTRRAPGFGAVYVDGRHQQSP
ncbi:hypothetical protein X949_5950 [Burkholderia pseudomallei MSHR5609]|nr:hypothetical protein X949_5950 [Burkholderia pseudomallei MSHR5609]